MNLRDNSLGFAQVEQPVLMNVSLCQRMTVKFATMYAGYHDGRQTGKSAKNQQLHQLQC